MSQNLLLKLVPLALFSFVDAENWRESKRIVEEQQELLFTDVADLLFAKLLVQYADDPNTTRFLQEQRALLQRCRREGIDKAFAELTLTPNARTNALIALVERLVGCHSPIAVLELAAQEPDLLSDEMDALLQQGVADAYAPGIEDGEAIANHVEACLEILRQLRKTMAQTGKSAQQLLESMRRRPEHAPKRPKSPSQALLSAIQAFGGASSEAERQRIVEQKRDLLLSDAALQVFARLLEQHKEDARAVAAFTEHRDLLIRCRKEGIEAAFADRIGRY